MDADHSGNWNFSESEDEPATLKSRTGYVITYVKCPIVWHSKLQGEIALSTTEAELISLSDSTRDVITLMGLIKEVKSQGFSVPTKKPTVHCKIFEDNSGALKIAKVPKIRSQTKHINFKYHHFRSFVDKGLLSIHPVGTSEQAAEIMTKALPLDDFLRHRLFLKGW